MNFKLILIVCCIDILFIGIENKVINDEMFLGETHESGIIDLGNGGDDIWYWLFDPRDKNNDAPLLLWLNGGPGCSDSDGIFYEMGPFNITEGPEFNLVRNDHSWNNHLYLLFVDQPVSIF